MFRRSHKGKEFCHELADREMTEALQEACPDRFPPKPDNPLICYRCDCKSGYCYKVMRYRTVQKPAISRFYCPAHNKSCARHSQYVAAFAQMVRSIDSSLSIVWDWKCVPEDSQMSIDATILCGHRGCANFEIDGPTHFEQKRCQRSEKDAEKDAIIRRHGWGLMRMHHKDKDVWGKYIKYHINYPKPHVQYTESYEQYLLGEHSIVSSRHL